MGFEEIRVEVMGTEMGVSKDPGRAGRLNAMVVETKKLFELLT
jgi:hypothetical protein